MRYTMLGRMFKHSARPSGCFLHLGGLVCYSRLAGRPCLATWKRDIAVVGRLYVYIFIYILYSGKIRTGAHTQAQEPKGNPSEALEKPRLAKIPGNRGFSDISGYFGDISGTLPGARSRSGARALIASGAAAPTAAGRKKAPT